MTSDPASRWRRIRIWLGDLLIAEYMAEREQASRYQRVMTPKFSGLRITVEPIPNESGGMEGAAPAVELPSEELWSLTVQ
jgi:hypothetical protein